VSSIVEMFISNLIISHDMLEHVQYDSKEEYRTREASIGV